ncbi:MAG: CPBP family intramembrane metalloprotease [Victivallaceae bacterium]|nr:CPBP family intramembrane metalloprotease [Victivallaceae bacterium]
MNDSFSSFSNSHNGLPPLGIFAYSIFGILLGFLVLPSLLCAWLPQTFEPIALALGPALAALGLSVLARDLPRVVAPALPWSTGKVIKTGFAAWFAAAIIAQGCILLFTWMHWPVDEPPLEQIFLLAQDKYQIALWCISVLAAPFYEEYLFRRVFYGAAALVAGERTAFAATVVLFAAIHGSFVQLLPLALLGTVFHLAYLKTGRLRSAILIHFLNNLISLAIILALRWTNGNL